MVSGHNEKILYEIYRLQALQSIIYLCKDNIEEWEKYKSLAYALNNRLYPYFDDDNDSIFEEFNDSVYDVSRCDMEIFSKYLTSQEDEYSVLNNNLSPLTYYQIQSAVGGAEKKYKLISFLKYAKLNKQYMIFYKNLNYNNESPIEANSLLKDIDFNISDIVLFNSYILLKDN